MIKRNACIIGAGITGLSIFHDLSGESVSAVIVEQNPYPGGQAVFYGCKATDTCVQCGVCLVHESLEKLQSAEKENILLSSRVVTVSRETENGFRIEVESSPNRLDWTLCTQCGKCPAACPEGAITPLPAWGYFINTACNDCGKCVDICPVNAIRLQREKKSQSILAESLVMAPGFTPYDPAVNRKWGYGTNKRVITGREMERLFYEEQYVPAGDMRKIAFIQCVGSRNIQEGMAGCSRVCCAYALRMAGRLKQEIPDSEIDMYYMDIQSFGKNYEQFRSALDGNINFIRSIPVNIESSAGGKPLVRYEPMDTSGCLEQPYDLVVLSHGITPAGQTGDLAAGLGINLDADGFLKPPAGALTSHPGLFLAGACKGPVRIDECVADASAVSAQMLRFLGGKQ